MIYRLPSLSGNKRNEIKRGRKIYFWDIGVRNAIISNFSEMNLRTDVGAIWENFMISERIKYINYHDISSETYFWRNKNQSEIDYAERRNNNYYAFEFKWNPKKKGKIPRSFLTNYPGSEANIVNPDNFENYIL